jgi:hypothetical protein
MDILDPLLARALHVATAIARAVSRLDEGEGTADRGRRKQTFAEIQPLAEELVMIATLGTKAN